MNFKLFLEGKYFNESSAVCGHCDSRLSFKTLAENPKHIYNKGSLFSCDCQKSGIWTNSIRNEKALIDYFQNKCDYYQGFCNDLFCPFCFKYIYNLQSGINYNGKYPVLSDEYPDIKQRADRYGCEKCPQNQNILVWRRKFDPENEKSTKKLVNFYKKLL